MSSKVTGTKLHNSYRGMKDRCYGLNNVSYPYYGGLGIRVCREWLAEYSKFKNWAYQNGYSEGLSIDRIDSSLGYYPDNCRWVTKAENTKEMLTRHYANSTGQFKDSSLLTITENNRNVSGAKFEMYLDDVLVSEYRCLIECAEFIVNTKNLTTKPVQIKKNISACLHGKRNKCHGFTFKWRNK